MDKKTLIVIAAIFATLLMLDSGFSLYSRSTGASQIQQVELSTFKKEAALITERIQQSTDIFSTNSSFLSEVGKKQNWTARLSAYKTLIDEDLSLTTSISKALQSGQTPPGLINDYIRKLKQDRKEALNGVTAILDEIQRFVRFHESPDKLAAEAELDYQFITEYDLKTLSARLKKAVLDWPAKKNDLEARMAILEEIKKAGNQDIQLVRTLASDPKANWEKLGLARQALISARQNIVLAAENSSKLVGELYYSRDKILEDMEETSGRYYHTYKNIKITSDSDHLEETVVEQIGKGFYDLHREDLGMTLETKPMGSYEFEAQKTTIPPGYSYVGNSKYGRWERGTGGSSFWVFYGQYRFLESLFWGSYYRPVYYSNYNTFTSYRRAGRTYYGTGASKRYGTQGSFTAKKHSASRYMKSGGFSGSKYATGSRSRFRSRSSSFKRGSTRMSRGGFFAGK